MPRWIVKAAWAAFAVICIGLVAPWAFAAPKATSIAECDYFWDAAITARGLAIAKVTSEQMHQVMIELFGPLRKAETEAHQRHAEIIRSIINAARISNSKTASEFAAALANTCNAQRGNMDSILGVSL